MITFPCCKINLGLNVIRKREDGFHDLQTVFYPVPLTDALEIKKMSEKWPAEVDCDLKVSGNTLECDEQNNLVVKAYNLLATDYKLPRIYAHLYKRIPSQAGLGGGSSDGAYMIRLLDERFRLNMGIAEMERYAAQLGSDCPFFITSETAYAEGRGNILEPADNETGNLEGYYIAIVKPDVAISTAEAYASITPRIPEKNCRDIVRQPILTWREELHNDFEVPVFEKYPQLKDIKDMLYDAGAIYAQMSGSGSAIFGIFAEEPKEIDTLFPEMFSTVLSL
jgi:4-diphosphocytidyl-2-C-methyl-D-erythritol kinase